MNARERLAAEQAALLRALLANGEPPPGFDPDRLKIEVAALLAKRRRVVAYLRPDLPRALGDRFPSLFDAYAVEHPRTGNVRARQDADLFAEWLVAQGELKKPRRKFSPLRWIAARQV